MLRLEILDFKHLNKRSWILCKGNLWEYLENLKEGFYSYSIQRKIVKNQYLDSLVSTIKQGDPIPIITLTCNDRNLRLRKGGDLNINMNKAEILDGLQRTFRLWSYYILIKQNEEYEYDDPIEFAKSIKDSYPLFFDSGLLNLTKVKNLFSDDEFSKIENAFKEFDIYLVVWANLTNKKVIHKMLVLNAGQRSVTKTHQFELLFLYLWEDLKDNVKLGIKLFREKDPEAIRVKRGERKIGEYIFSSVIVGLRSYLENRPLRVTIDDLDVNYLDHEEFGTINEEIFDEKFISDFLRHIREVDQVVFVKEGIEGLKWYAKDTTLSGILAGLGKYYQVNSEMDITEIEILTKRGFNNLKNKINKTGFRLRDFTKQYNLLSSRSVNIGSFIRKVVMNYTISLLDDSKPSWEKLFKL